MNVVYKPWRTEEIEQYRCRLSGRKDFDGYEAAWKARWLVQQGHAEWAMVFDDENPYAHWESNPITRDARKLLGPDL